MAQSDQHCTFVLLAEFDIDKGAQLTHQFPQPLGTDEGLLANLMLPDGAERQLEDWTIFFLNQTPFNTIAPVLALEDLNGHGYVDGDDSQELLYVLNLVRTKHDPTVRRGAVVKAMAICTRHPFIQIYKPILLLALDDYFTDPSQDCLARLFDSVNAMDISMAPMLTRHEKLIMRMSDRKDVFAEKFVQPASSDDGSSKRTLINHSNGSRFSVQDNIRNRSDSLKSHESASESSFSLGGSAVWVGDESTSETVHVNHLAKRGRSATGASKNSSVKSGRGSETATISTSHILESATRHGPKDTQVYQTTIGYKGHNLPIRVPLATFPEEVGDYSLIQLIQVFSGSGSGSTISGPQHPHLHSNGSLTHPIILLFNALVTGKRILFLGHQRPAGQVSSFVLAACALGSGCGAVLRGFIARAFPYATLTNREDWQNIDGYIAGVTNPIFKTAGSWDVLCDIGTGRITVNDDIHASWPSTMSSPPPSFFARMPSLRRDGSFGHEDDLIRVSTTHKEGREASSSKSEGAGKPDSYDNAFMEDIISAISNHFGESLVRARMTEYVQRFTRLAARYEEDAVGPTKIGYPTRSFVMEGKTSQLGSGIIFQDEASAARELSVNSSRIDAWRHTKMYRHFQSDFKNGQKNNAIGGFDLWHQLWRLRSDRAVSDVEAQLIMDTLAENVIQYEQVVELLAALPPHQGGLLPLSYCLFHTEEGVRDAAVDLLDNIRQYPIGIQFLQGLNHFHRFAYARQARTKELIIEAWSRLPERCRHFPDCPDYEPHVHSEEEREELAKEWINKHPYDPHPYPVETHPIHPDFDPDRPFDILQKLIVFDTAPPQSPPPVPVQQSDHGHLQVPPYGERPQGGRNRSQSSLGWG